MSKIYWDSMLIIYLLEGNPTFSKRVQHLLQRSFERGDSLYTSFLAYGEVMAGAVNSSEKVNKIKKTMEEMGFTYLPFDGGAVMPFSRLRAKKVLHAP